MFSAGLCDTRKHGRFGAAFFTCNGLAEAYSLFGRAARDWPLDTEVLIQMVMMWGIPQDGAKEGPRTKGELPRGLSQGLAQGTMLGRAGPHISESTLQNRMVAVIVQRFLSVDVWKFEKI